MTVHHYHRQEVTDLLITVSCAGVNDVDGMGHFCGESRQRSFPGHIVRGHVEAISPWEVTRFWRELVRQGWAEGEGAGDWTDVLCPQHNPAAADRVERSLVARARGIATELARNLQMPPPHYRPVEDLDIAIAALESERAAIERRRGRRKEAT